MKVKQYLMRNTKKLFSHFSIHAFTCRQLELWRCRFPVIIVPASRKVARSTATPTPLVVATQFINFRSHQGTGQEPVDELKDIMFSHD